MPLITVTPRRLAVAAAVAAGLGTAPGTALAASECPSDEQTTPLFQDFDNDPDRYFAAPGGTFEGAQVAQVTGTTRLVTDAHGIGQVGKTALSMASGATVTTGSFCVDETRRHARFLLKRTSEAGSVRVEAIREDGETLALAAASTPAAGVWDASDPVLLAAPLGISSGATEDVRLRLVATGSWIVDGIVVDPYRR